MAINIADNMGYNGKKPLDGRTEYATLSAMKAVVDANINEGCLAYNKEDEKYYIFKSTNTVDATTGKWREFETGGGGGHTIQDDGVDMTARDNLNFVGFNVTDDSTNNRTTVTFPNIDLSVLSNEAFILSATEKAVGMNTDRKLLYAKTIDFGTVTSGDQYLTVDVSSLNIDELVLFLGRINRSSEILSIPCWYTDNQNITWNGLSNNALTVKVKGFSNGDTVTMIALYTKTTDSPLPAGVKFAGVTASGEVIYEKTLTNLSILVSSSGWTQVTTIANGKSVYGITALRANSNLSGSKNLFAIKDAEFRSGGALYITSVNEDRYITDLIVHYTLAS